MNASRKTADQPFLNDTSGISPKTVSHSENTPPRIHKKNISRDTEQHLPSPLQGSGNHRTPPFFSETGQEQALIRNPGMRFELAAFSR